MKIIKQILEFIFESIAAIFFFMMVIICIGIVTLLGVHIAGGAIGLVYFGIKYLIKML